MVCACPEKRYAGKGKTQHQKLRAAASYQNCGANCSRNGQGCAVHTLREDRDAATGKLQGGTVQTILIPGNISEGLIFKETQHEF